jgi:hypothetical protein
MTSKWTGRTTMSKRSHNKKRNVGIIYEQLLAIAAKGLVENDKKLTSKAQKIIKRFFKEGNELYKEYRLFKALVEPEIKDGSLATKILGEAKKAARTHNVQRLEREKSRLIKEVNYSFGKDFYNQRIENYTDFATIQTLLNDWRDVGNADFNQVTVFESRVHAILTKPKVNNSLMKEHDKEVDNLVVKVMTEKYNDKYGKQLTEIQQLLVKQYVFAESGDTKGFQEMLNRIKEHTLKDLTDFEVECDNSHVSRKIHEVRNDIRNLNINTLDDQTMSRFLTLCDLSEELRRKKQ